MADQPVKDDTNKEELLKFYKLVLPEQSLEEIGQAMNDASIAMGKDEFAKSFSEIGSFVELLKRMLDAHTDQTAFIANSLGKIIDTKLIGDEYSHTPVDAEDIEAFSIKNRVLNVDKSLNGAEVSGRQAQLLILASNGNIKKIPLYNSGFYITLKGPTLGDINLVYNRLSEEMNEYGRMFGAIFYMNSDHKIKDIIWDFIRSLTIDSNLNKWDKSDRLKANISLLDYQPIVLAIGSLMFKNGYDFIHVCTNKECNHTETEIIDLNLLQLTDFSKIPTEMLLTLSKSQDVDPNDVRKYKDLIRKDDEFTIGKYLIHMKVPSVGDYLRYGETFNAEMKSAIQDLNDSQIIEQYLKYNFTKIFMPWIRTISVIDESGSISFKVSDDDSIGLILHEIQKMDDNDKFTEAMNGFIYSNTITHTGYMTKPCSKCGKAQTGSTNGLIPFDAQNSFFTMLVMRLIQAS